MIVGWMRRCVCLLEGASTCSCVCVGVCMYVSAVAHCFACLSVTEILEYGLQPVAKLAFAPK